MNKEEIRKSMIKKRDDSNNRDEMDEIIKRKLKRSNFYKSSNNIFIYVGFKSEINTINYINEFLEDGKKVFIPRTDVKTKTMEAIEITSLRDLVRSDYGILEPKREKKAINKNQLDLIIFPGVAFDKKGYRIGYGAGYYDKFMKDIHNEVFKVALCYDFQIVNNVPYEEHDVRVSCILTEKREIVVA